jgi:tripartite-type tricarboxylate transporter receptor subunit TctC
MYSRRAVLGSFAIVLPVMAQRKALALSRTIRLLVPFTVGTGPDLLARILTEELKERWHQAVIVENKPGASGNIGTEAVARAIPDGDTLLVTVNTFVMNASLYRSLPFDPKTSFAPIIEIATGALALVVHPSINVSTLPELIALARSKPGVINYASPGRGTPQHLAMELFKLTSKIDLTHIPYTGAADATRDLVGGHVSAMFLPVHTALPLAEAGQIRILAVGSQMRSPRAPEVPTLAELGVTDFQVDWWCGVLAPADTSTTIIDRYNSVFNEILDQASVRDALEKQGLAISGGSPAKLAALIAKDLPRWAKVVKDANIGPE